MAHLTNFSFDFLCNIHTRCPSTFPIPWCKKSKMTKNSNQGPGGGGGVLPTQRLQRLQDSFSKRHGIMLPPLQKRFDYHTLELIYRIREKLAPDDLLSLLPSLISSTSGFSLRKPSYPVPFTKKSATLNSFLPRAIILWNTLPFDVQSSKSLGMFKSKLKTHLSL